MRNFSGLLVIGALAAGAYVVSNDVGPEDVITGMSTATERVQGFVSGINVEGEERFETIEDEAPSPDLPEVVEYDDPLADSEVILDTGDTKVYAAVGTETPPVIEAPNLVARRPQAQQGSETVSE